MLTGQTALAQKSFIIKLDFQVQFTYNNTTLALKVLPIQKETYYMYLLTHGNVLQSHRIYNCIQLRLPDDKGIPQ